MFKKLDTEYTEFAVKGKVMLGKRSTDMSRETVRQPQKRAAPGSLWLAHSLRCQEIPLSIFVGSLQPITKH